LKKESLHKREATTIHQATESALKDLTDPETGKSFKEAALEWKEKCV